MTGFRKSSNFSTKLKYITTESASVMTYCRHMTQILCTNILFIQHNKIKVVKLPLTGCGGPWSCETSRLPHFLCNWLTDSGEVVSPMYQLPFNSRKIPGINSYYWPQGHRGDGRIRSTEV
jgi:hypothetical protein